MDVDEELLTLSADNEGDHVADGVVLAVKKIYSNGDFVIFACKGGYTVKGNFHGELTEEMRYIVNGKVTMYGNTPQIVATSVTQVVTEKNDIVLIAHFLSDNLDGIGKKTAMAIAEEYGKDCLRMLLETPRDVAKKIKGLSSAKALEISGKIDEDIDYLNMILDLMLFGLSDKKAKKAYAEFGILALEDIKRNPYVLMRINGFGFELCEKIAGDLGTDAADPLRFEGAIEAALKELHASTGNMYFSRSQVRAAAMKLLKKRDPDGIMNTSLAESAFLQAEEMAVTDKLIVIYHFREGKCAACAADESDARISLRSFFDTEVTIKREVENFIKAPCVIPDDIDVNERISSLAKARDITLDERQAEALTMCMFRPISIITGGPGTGKTTVTGILAEHFKKEKIKAEFCAPTGRAAKRLSEAAGVKAKTIHRLLEMSADTDDDEDDRDIFFGRNRNNPIDARVVVADEASMIDSKLFAALLRAIRPDSSLILIGDPDQLPSVGPGNVLSDLLSCRAIPRVCLEYIFRNDDESSIPSNSVRILKGENVIGNGNEFVVIDTDSDEEALQKIKELHAGLTAQKEDFVVLSPTKQNLIGTTSINAVLQEQNDAKPFKVRSDLSLKKGDRVIQSKNNYSIEYYDPSSFETVKGIFNGEIGTVSGSDFLKGGCDIVFDDGRHVNYDKKALNDIELAYAITVHKAQGCEFDTIVLALGKMNPGLSDRKLLYTAVTRGKKRVIIINSGGRLQKMTASVQRLNRKTSLGDFLSIVEKRYLG